jgi:hypothetical protein
MKKKIISISFNFDKKGYFWQKKGFRIIFQLKNPSTVKLVNRTEPTWVRGIRNPKFFQYFDVFMNPYRSILLYLNDFIRFIWMILMTSVRSNPTRNIKKIRFGSIIGKVFVIFEKLDQFIKIARIII